MGGFTKWVIRHRTVSERRLSVNMALEDSDVFVTSSASPRNGIVLLLFCCSIFLAACGSDGGTGPAPAAPVITVTGIEQGGRYSGPVTIAVQVDRGSWEATLNGQPFSSGQTVTAPGDYTLAVAARNGTAQSASTLTFTILAPAGGTLIVRLLDLGPDTLGGGGDAILVTDSSAAGLVHALIDAGPSAFTPAYVADRLAELHVDTLVFVMLTHAHGDHFGGLPAVLNRFAVRRFYYNGQIRTLGSYTSVLNLAQQRADSVIMLRDTVPLPFGRSAEQSRWTLIHGLPTYLNTNTGDGTMLNEGSLGASLRRGSFSMFFTGDGEYAANARWRTQFASYTRNVTALKVGHHGANNAIFDAGTTGPSSWLEHTTPRVSVISANGLTHPRLRALTRLLQQTNNRTYCTSVHGEITIRIWSNGTYNVAVEREPDSDCRPGAAATT
jgi:competence protein ComEC